MSINDNEYEYYDERTDTWHVRPSVVEKESRDYELHRKWASSSARYHKGTDRVAPYGYKRDIIFGETAIARDINNVRKKR